MTAPTIAPDQLAAIDALDDFSLEVACDYGPPGRVICETGEPARWRIVYHADCGCYAPQLICEPCRHRQRTIETEIARRIQSGTFCVHCVVCRTHIDWQPSMITPLPRPA